MCAAARTTDIAGRKRNIHEGAVGPAVQLLCNTLPSSSASAVPLSELSRSGANPRKGKPRLDYG
jgi:hypothetical protein